MGFLRRSLIRFSKPFPISIPGTIIDIETTALQHPDGYIVSFGHLRAYDLSILQRTDVVDDEFDESVRCLVKFLPRPFCAYNSGFEESWLGVKFDHDLFERWRQLSEKMDDGGIRTQWPSLMELMAGPYATLGTHDILGHQVPLLWNDYLQTRDSDILMKISDHNYFDLLRDCCLLIWDHRSMLEALSALLRERRDG